MGDRNEVVKLARSWVGLNEKDGSYKKIIDIYNSYKGPFPRGIRMKPEWSWCACTWSALAIKLGYTDIMPIEISCGELINAAKKMRCWEENDAYIPLPGDAILYDWDDTGKGDNTGWPDHVGMVEYVNSKSNTFTVIEGNYQDSVKKRTMSMNGRYIRGFITPKYDKTIPIDVTPEKGKSLKEVAYDVIAGMYGSGTARKNRLKAAGYDPDKVQAKVNEILNQKSTKPEGNKKTVSTNCAARYKALDYAGTYKTTANLYCRMDAGADKKALCQFPKGTKVACYGYYSVDVASSKPYSWLLVCGVLDGITYTGFCHSDYLKEIKE